jgi:hypothetical protein
LRDGLDHVLVLGNDPFDVNAAQDGSFLAMVEVFMDGTRYSLFIIAATVASVIQGIMAIDDGSLDADPIFAAFDLAFFSIFAADFVLRCTAMGPARYFEDSLCVVDFVVVAIDVLFIALVPADGGAGAGKGGAAGAAEASTLAKTLRLMRLLRLLRLVRAAKMARALRAEIIRRGLDKSHPMRFQHYVGILPIGPGENLEHLAEDAIAEALALDAIAGECGQDIARAFRPQEATAELGGFEVGDQGTSFNAVQSSDADGLGFEGESNFLSGVAMGPNVGALAAPAAIANPDGTLGRQNSRLTDRNKGGKGARGLHRRGGSLIPAHASIEAARFSAAYAAVISQVCSVEISWRGVIEKVQFIKPPFCEISEPSRRRLERELDISTESAKIHDFLARAEGIHDEMKHLHAMERWAPRVRALLRWRSEVHAVAFLAVAAASALLVLFDRLADAETIKLCRADKSRCASLQIRARGDKGLLSANTASMLPDTLKLPNAAELISILIVSCATVAAFSYLVLVGALVIARAPVIALEVRRQRAEEEEEQQKRARADVATGRTPRGERSRCGYFFSSLATLVFVLGGSAVLLSRGGHDVSEALFYDAPIAGVLLIFFCMHRFLSAFEALAVGHSEVRQRKSAELFAVAWRAAGDSEILPKIICLTVLCFSLANGSLINLPWCLLDVITQSPSMRDVTRAVIKPRKQLLSVGLLFFILLTIGACVAYANLEQEFLDQASCQSLLDCWLTTVYEALIHTGDLTGVLSATDALKPKTFAVRFAFDLGFYLVVGVLLFSMVSGIIIDTFARIRLDTMKRDWALENVCLICSLSRQEWQVKAKTLGVNQTLGFDEHAKKDHAWVNYVYFLSHLRTHDPLDFSGAELYVHELVRKHNFGWIPRQTCHHFAAIEATRNAAEAEEKRASKRREAKGEDVLTERLRRENRILRHENRQIRSENMRLREISMERASVGATDAFHAGGGGDGTDPESHRRARHGTLRAKRGRTDEKNARGDPTEEELRVLVEDEAESMLLDEGSKLGGDDVWF